MLERLHECTDNPFPDPACLRFAALFAVVIVPAPYGPSLGFFLLVFGLWFGRRIFKRIATLDEIKADLRQRVDEGP
ncbi:hypothetical protein SIAM614_08339 [Stappia aggregata IAM 12614]|uniref:Uncharacterized protein n=1 Tax=Roseibium aggregatum (strain ATCC 25650 / DSM 13394 / JCM 20685 / NBRC 16684 / NCIMB 2208 / IAM 12614 / B1) TaxID=384765 RepID=A0P231_ROSAI|nr:hypothetical protein [Roseibium aggregatum]EAV40887.1 hypothetical protein SIAM614_08339 [Stappia aggregata IAM 12614] [Roseibium aggregatum IAM 12614]